MTEFEEKVAAAMTAYVEMKLCAATNVRLLAPCVAAAIEAARHGAKPSTDDTPAEMRFATAREAEDYAILNALRGGK